MKRQLSISVFLLALGLSLDAQPIFPVAAPLFSDTLVPRIDITIDQASLDAIYADVESNIEYPASFIFSNGEIRDTVFPVGFRLRGNTSRYSWKKSFKVSFNSFSPGKKYRGLEKMNLNGEHNDPSITRSKLSWDLLAAFGLPAPRSNHIELYINKIFWGVYVNVEHIDEEFMEARFGNQDGNLYKCLWPADLKYISDNPEDYKFIAGDRRAYDLRTNTEADDYTDLAQFINVINNTPPSQLPCELEKIFNVPDYIKTLAFDVIISNWDGYAFNKNNFYLYHNTLTDKFEFILYDLDNTYGIDWFGVDWGERDIYSWSPGIGERPLYDIIMEVPKYRNQYSFYVRQMAEEFLNTGLLFPRLDSLRNGISALVAEDPFYALDYGYDHNDFLRSFLEATGAHVKYGIKPYILARKASANIQLESNPMVPVLKYLNNNHPRLDENVIISAHVESDDLQTFVELVYTTNGGAQQKMTMFDNGIEPDITANDNKYTTGISGFNQAVALQYQVRVSKAGDSYIDLQPCEPVNLAVFESKDPNLMINEFMAGNDVTIADEFGEYDDWIEIYNADPTPVWLGDKYLTDDLGQPQRWLMPDHVMEPGDFMLIWADDNNGQGETHTNFRLSKGGEAVAIVESSERASAIIDSLEFGAQMDDISFGRITDGGGSWRTFDNPTPGYSNLLTSSQHGTNETMLLQAFPNPVYQGRVFFNKVVSVQLYDLSGRMLLQGSDINMLDITGIPAGIYIIRSSEGESVKVLKY